MSALLKPKEVAQMLNVSTRQVQLMAHDGRLRSVRISERVTRIYADSVAKILEAGAGHADS